MEYKLSFSIRFATFIFLRFVINGFQILMNLSEETPVPIHKLYQQNKGPFSLLDMIV